MDLVLYALCKKLVSNAQSSEGEEFKKELAAYKEQVDETIATLQEEINGNSQVFFGENVPTNETLPASEWIEEADKKKHLGDLYFIIKDDNSGAIYRYCSENGVYSWKIIPDTDATKALEETQTLKTNLANLNEKIEPLTDGTFKTEILSEVDEKIAENPGPAGATWKPIVSETGELSWTQDSSEEAPSPVNIKGDKGDKGEPGPAGLDGKDGSPGAAGKDGATWRPSVDEDGALTWTQDSSVDAPAPVNIKGPKGDKGEPGQNGADGAPGKDGSPGTPGQNGAPGADGQDGATWVPSVSEEGLLTWTKNGETEPTPINIKGDQGPAGPQGPQGLQGLQGEPGKDGAPGEPGAPGKDGTPGERGPAGPAGQDGQNGQDGKSAYAYAQEGGYSGDETQFYQDLAAVAGLGTILDEINGEVV